MMYIMSQVLGWIATFFRASGMLAKNPMTVKWLVSVGNLGWMLSGILTENVPLIVSNALCLIVMVFEIIKNRKGEKNGSETPRTSNLKDERADKTI